MCYSCAVLCGATHRLVDEVELARVCRRVSLHHAWAKSHGEHPQPSDGRVDVETASCSDAYLMLRLRLSGHARVRILIRHPVRSLHQRWLKWGRRYVAHAAKQHADLQYAPWKLSCTCVRQQPRSLSCRGRCEFVCLRCQQRTKLHATALCSCAGTHVHVYLKTRVAASSSNRRSI